MFLCPPFDLVPVQPDLVLVFFCFDTFEIDPVHMGKIFNVGRETLISGLSWGRQKV